MSDHATINPASKPDHGQRYVPGSEQAPENLAPQPLDHFNRGYQERASLRARETEALGSCKAFDAQGFVHVLCRPGCNLAQELEKARAADPEIHSEKAMTTILSSLARIMKVGEAFAVWQWMDSAGIEKNVFHYNTMISACEKTKDHRRAMQLLQEMDSKGIAKNHITYSSAISACEKAGQWQEALRLLDQMKSSGVLPTAVAYNAAISACEKGLVPQRAVQLFDQMKRDGVTPTVVTYSALISAADKGQQWKLALELLEEMKAAGHGANVIAYSAAISALSKGRMWAKALELFRELESSGNTPSIVTYNATMSALEKGLQWERALDLFDEMKMKGLAVTVVSYGSALSACEKGLQYRQCLEYLDEMTEMGIAKNVIIFGAAMSCMEKAHRADIAFLLMDRMKTEGVAPNVHIYNSAISACARSGLWEKGLELFNEMEQCGVARDFVSYNAVLDAVCSQVSLARRLFKEGLERGFYAKVSRLGAQWLELDLHFLSLGSGEVALQWWLEECLVPYLADSPKLQAVKSIDIVTGFGKTRSRGARQCDDGMKKRIRAMLGYMNIHETEQSNKGRIRIDKEALVAEVTKNGGKIVFDRAGYSQFKRDQTNAVPEVEQKVRTRILPKRVGEIGSRYGQDRCDQEDRGGRKRQCNGANSYHQRPNRDSYHRNDRHGDVASKRQGYRAVQSTDSYSRPRNDSSRKQYDYFGGSSNSTRGRQENRGDCRKRPCESNQRPIDRSEYNVSSQQQQAGYNQFKKDQTNAVPEVEQKVHTRILPQRVGEIRSRYGQDRCDQEDRGGGKRQCDEANRYHKRPDRDSDHDRRNDRHGDIASKRQGYRAAQSSGSYWRPRNDSSGKQYDYFGGSNNSTRGRQENRGDCRKRPCESNQRPIDRSEYKVSSQQQQRPGA